MEMRELIEKVEEFHKAFGHPIGTVPKNLSEDEVSLRFELLDEELVEYSNACDEDNLVEIADALGDQLYILLGTIIQHGMQNKIEEVFNRIHISNMSKLGIDGKPIYRQDGKILKGENFRPVNLKDLF